VVTISEVMLFEIEVIPEITEDEKKKKRKRTCTTERAVLQRRYLRSSVSKTRAYDPTEMAGCLKGMGISRACYGEAIGDFQHWSEGLHR
jgi:predicted transcriptional regulator with HTH domain